MSLSDQQLLNSVLDTLTAAMAGWAPLLVLYATRILAVIVAIQFIYIGVEVARSHDATRLLDQIATGAIRIGLVYVLLSHGIEWGNAIISTGIQVGQAVTGQSPAVLTPSGVFNLGLGTAGILLQANAASAWLHPVQEIEFFFGALAVILLWAGAALIYLLTLLEAAWVVTIGVLLIAFSALDHTISMLIRLATDILSLAIKIAVLMMLLATGMVLAQEWQVLLAGNSGIISTDAYWLLISIVQAVVLFMLVLKLPARIVSIVGGSVAGWGESGFSAAMGAASSASGPAASAIGKKAAAGAEAVKGVGSTTRSLLLS